MIVFSMQAVAYLLIATRLPGIFLYLSIVFYGLVAWSIPSIMAAAMGDYVGVRNVAAAFGLVTFIFGLGQITGRRSPGSWRRGRELLGQFLHGGGLRRRRGSAERVPPEAGNKIRNFFFRISRPFRCGP